MTRVVGAVLAGGASRRFGSDKAMAPIDGNPMIRHVLGLLGRQVDGLVMCGRDMPDVPSVADQPRPGLGPLAGLAAALDFAHRQGFAAVLSVPCDTPDLPPDLRSQMGDDGPVYVIDQPVIGLWPAVLADELMLHLDAGNRSMRSWIDRIGATPITLTTPLTNINTPSDLASWQCRHD